MNRGPIILVSYWDPDARYSRFNWILFFNRFMKTIEEAEYILDQFPPPSPDEDEITTKLRTRFQQLLQSLRTNAEGTSKET